MKSDFRGSFNGDEARFLPEADPPLADDARSSVIGAGKLTPMQKKF